MRLPRYYHFYPASLSVPKQHTFSSIEGKCYKEVIDPYQELPPAEETDLNHVLRVGGSLEDRSTNYIQSNVDVSPLFTLVPNEKENGND